MAIQTSQTPALTCLRVLSIMTIIVNQLHPITAATITQTLKSINPTKNAHDELIKFSRA
ncbi:hypothetical protein HK102_009725, partial [Quaeritorhiza haematococci]